MHQQTQFSSTSRIIHRSKMAVKEPVPKSVGRPKMHEQKSKLVRSSSMETIRKFNTFICSQHYYLVPALLTWLKSSHSALQASAEKTIRIFRSLIFNVFLNNFVWFVSKMKMEAAVTLEKVLHSTVLMYVTVYIATMIVYGHLFAGLYLLFSVQIPSGLYFLLITCSYIVFLCYKSLHASKFDKQKKKVQ